MRARCGHRHRESAIAPCARFASVVNLTGSGRRMTACSVCISPGSRRVDSHRRSSKPHSSQRLIVLSVLLAVFALAALPAAASAQPDNDDYYGTFVVNQPGTPLPGSIGFAYTLADATVQANI